MAKRSLAGARTPDFRPFELEAGVIAVLANPKRLMIVNLLGVRPATVSTIATGLGLTLQNTSQHLRVMRDRGIVRFTRVGREVRYRLSTPAFSQACRLVRRALLEEACLRPTYLHPAGEFRASARVARGVSVPEGPVAVSAHA